jgi:hypothetical protein
MTDRGRMRSGLSPEAVGSLGRRLYGKRVDAWEYCRVFDIKVPNFDGLEADLEQVYVIARCQRCGIWTDCGALNERGRCEVCSDFELMSRSETE